MSALLPATGGFLLAVLWMDLMFDVQARGRNAPADAAVASIAAYYRRVTTDVFPMNRLIGVVMLLQAAGIVDQVLVRRSVGGWRGLAVVVLGLAPIALAIVRIFPAAVRLGARGDDVTTQAATARAIYRGHVLCLAAILAFVVLELTLGR